MASSLISKACPWNLNWKLINAFYTMSSANVLPSTPPESSWEPLCPVLTAPAENFHLQKIHKIAKVLDQEVGHYHLTTKYKRQKTFINWSAPGSSVLSAPFSSTSFGLALSIKWRWQLFCSCFFRANNCQQET